MGAPGVRVVMEEMPACFCGNLLHSLYPLFSRMQTKYRSKTENHIKTDFVSSFFLSGAAAGRGIVLRRIVFFLFDRER
jgi:hypothetical protein